MNQQIEDAAIQIAQMQASIDNLINQAADLYVRLDCQPASLTQQHLISVFNNLTEAKRKLESAIELSQKVEAGSRE